MLNSEKGQHEQLSLLQEYKRDRENRRKTPRQKIVMHINTSDVHPRHSKYYY